jgi:hypothetical protein
LIAIKDLGYVELINTLKRKTFSLKSLEPNKDGGGEIKPLLRRMGGGGHETDAESRSVESLTSPIANSVPFYSTRPT